MNEPIVSPWLIYWAGRIDMVQGICCIVGFFVTIYAMFATVAVVIVKLPWKPKKGDACFSFALLGDKWVVGSLYWGGFPSECALLDKGWVYRTKEEAEAALPKVATEIGVKYEL